MYTQNEFKNFQDPVFNNFLKPKKKRRWLKPFLITVAVVLLVLIIILTPALINGYGILQRVNQLKARVDPTMAYVKDGNWNKVNDNLDATKSDLIYIQDKLHHLGLVAYIPEVNKKIFAADHLIGASVKLLSGFGEIINLVASVDTNATNVNGIANQISTGNKKGILQAISKNRDALDRISQSLKEAQDELALISSSDLLGQYGGQFQSLYKSLSSIVDDSELVLPIFKKLPEILGENQEKTYLVVFENNMEMRATGGFIGSYAILKVKDGEITSMFTDDVYNLDKLSKDKLNAVAPAPIQTYLKQKYWFMRDSNWSPDWPTSAKQITWFFDSERRIAGLPDQPVDGVIAITPDLIADMLSLVGSVDVYGQKFESQNFALDLEKFVESDYANQGISVSQRKSIIGPLAQVIMDRIKKMPPSTLINLWSVIQKSIDEKHILIYFDNAELQKYFSDHDWAGAIADSGSDYLMVVDSNMAALKTDSVMTKSIAYGLQENTGGNLSARLEVDYKHSGKYQRDLISMYRDYARFYLPLGSRVQSAKIIEGNKETVLNPSDMVIYNELGKTAVGIFFTVDVGHEKKIVLNYDLPQNIQDQYQNGLYKLFVQKQPGTSGHNLKINLEFRKQISAYDYISAPQKLGGNVVNWNTDLNRDRIFSVKLN